MASKRGYPRWLQELDCRLPTHTRLVWRCDVGSCTVNTVYLFSVWMVVLRTAYCLRHAVRSAARVCVSDQRA